jgi:N-dimethylarginine dimethylaminohydrolase
MPSLTASPRRYLMCTPTYFDVTYSVNVWMDPRKPTDTSLAIQQWETLKSGLVDLGHAVELIDPLPGQPDMVFTANAAVVIGQRAIGAHFSHRFRDAETVAYAEWLKQHGFNVRMPRFVSEGEGDYLIIPESDKVVAAYGIRTEASAHAELADWLQRDVISARMIDPRFYHLDTALAVLDTDSAIYYPGAFDEAGRTVLSKFFPCLIEIPEADAVEFGANAISDGMNVLIDQGAVGLGQTLSERGYAVRTFNMSELKKSGGSVKCCVLDLSN